MWVGTSRIRQGRNAGARVAPSVGSQAWGGAPNIGLAFNVLAPPTEELAAGYVPAANKIYLIPVS